MKNMLEINGYRAVIQFDPDIDMFRGEFVGLNDGADFYARDIASLKAEGEASLKVFLAMCREDGVEPGKQYSGKFNVRISPELHATIAVRCGGGRQEPQSMDHGRTAPRRRRLSLPVAGFAAGCRPTEALAADGGLLDLGVR